MLRLARIVVLLLCALPCRRGLAHDLQYTIEERETLYVTFSSAGEDALAFETYEIYRGGEEIPFQVGRTDERGRLVFLPDRPGIWRIRVFSEDGHGLDVSFTTDARGCVDRGDRPMVERHRGVVIGVAFIFGLFGLLSLFVRRGRRR